MTTLIAVYNSDGLVGRCDARCYNATGPDCDCICGGKNHGAGQSQAAENTREMAEHWIERYTRASGEGERCWWEVPASQAALPMDETPRDGAALRDKKGNQK